MMNENKIVEKSSALYAKYGIKGVSVDDVAFVLGISKKTLYEYIENKNVLIQKVVDNNLATFFDKVTEKAEEESDIFKSLCLIYLNTIREVKKINPSYIHDLKKYHHKQYRKILEFRDHKLYKTIENFINQGIKTGIFRNDLDMQYVYVNQMSKVSILLFDSFFECKEQPSVQDIYKMILNDIRGITTLKGHEIFDRNYDDLLQLK
ncbi:MAG: TetR/AcrR family transcriptional regulator [Prolixibacteraceae bacterium]|nr:TetR/AcrR family transcriptional regulator [Prolixibacteraceae bacterium]